MNIERFRNLEEMNDSIAELSISMEKVRDEEPVIFDPERDITPYIWGQFKSIYEAFVSMRRYKTAAQCAADMRVIAPSWAKQRLPLDSKQPEFADMLGELSVESKDSPAFRSYAKNLRTAIEDPALVPQEIIDKFSEDFHVGFMVAASTGDPSRLGLMYLYAKVLFPEKDLFFKDELIWSDLKPAIEVGRFEPKSSPQANHDYSALVIEAKLLFPERFPDINIPIDIRSHWAELWETWKQDHMLGGVHYIRLARDLAVIYAKKAEMTPGGIVIDNSPEIAATVEYGSELPQRLKFDQ